MEVEKNKNFTRISGTDENGEFSIEIQNDCSQLRLESDDLESYVNLNYNELRIIRNAITEVLDNYLQ